MAAEAAFREILRLVKTGSPEALDKLDQVDARGLGDADRRLLEELRQELKDYEFARAKKILEKLMEGGGRDSG